MVEILLINPNTTALDHRSGSENRQAVCREGHQPARRHRRVRSALHRLARRLCHRGPRRARCFRQRQGPQGCRRAGLLRRSRPGRPQGSEQGAGRRHGRCLGLAGLRAWQPLLHRDRRRTLEVDARRVRREPRPLLPAGVGAHRRADRRRHRAQPQGRDGTAGQRLQGVRTRRWRRRRDPGRRRAGGPCSEAEGHGRCPSARWGCLCDLHGRRPRTAEARQGSRRRSSPLPLPCRASIFPKVFRSCSDRLRVFPMRLVSFRHAGAPKFGAAVDGGIIDLSERTGARWPSLRAAIAAKALDELAAAAKDAKADLPFDEVELLPVIPDPDKILCIGLNYASHVGEVGRQVPTAAQRLLAPAQHAGGAWRRHRAAARLDRLRLRGRAGDRDRRALPPRARAPAPCR